MQHIDQNNDISTTWIFIKFENIRVYKEFLLRGSNLAVGLVIEYFKDDHSSCIGVLNQVAGDTVKEITEVPFADGPERHPSMPFQPGAWGGQKGAHPIKMP